jgi:hypothetical protein
LLGNFLLIGNIFILLLRQKTSNPLGTSYQFLNNPDVKKALNYEEIDKEWLGCIPGAGRRLQRQRVMKTQKEEEALPGETLLAHDTPESMTSYIRDLLDDAGIRVLVYAGDRDLTTNLQGSEMVLDGMVWSGHSAWRRANRYLWMVNENVAGYVKTYKNLDLLLVLNSGHLVPYNVPVPALDLITRLTNEKSFGDIILPRISSASSRGGSSEGVENQTITLSHKFFHSFLLILVAIVCFACGALAGAWWVQSRFPEYEQIPEGSNGNHFLIDNSLPPNGKSYND